MLKKMLQSDSDVVSHKLGKLGGPRGLNQEIIFGRGAEVDVALDSQRCPLLISRKHASLKRVGNHLFLSDSRSTNGTYVNDQKLHEGESRLLKDNDVISFGGATKVRQMNSRDDEFNPFLYKLKHTKRLFEEAEINATQLATVDSTGAQPTAVVDLAGPSQTISSDSIIDLTGATSPRYAQAPSRRRALAATPSPLKRSTNSDTRKAMGMGGSSLKRGNVVNLESDQGLLDDLVVPPLRKSPARGPAADAPTDSASKGDNPTLKALEEQFECQICREFLIGAHSLVPCGHMFCGECACEWLEKKRTCPACRVETTSAPVPLVKIDNIIEDIVVPQMNGEAKSERDRRKLIWARNKASHTAKIERLHNKQQPRAGHQLDPMQQSILMAATAHMGNRAGAGLPGITGPPSTFPFTNTFGQFTSRRDGDAGPTIFSRVAHPGPHSQMPNMQNLPSGTPQFSVTGQSGRRRLCDACSTPIQSQMPTIVKHNGPNSKTYYHVGCESRIPGFLSTWRLTNGNIPGVAAIGHQNQIRINHLVNHAPNVGRRGQR